MKNPKIGERVISKIGLSDNGRIICLNADGTVGVEWHYQDGSREISQFVDLKNLRREKRLICEKCRRPL